ncbi:MAG: hypothetical protein V2A56_08955 [bacterium]
MVKSRTRFLVPAMIGALLLISGNTQAQMADNIGMLEMLHLINAPTAGVLKQGQYQIDLRAYGDGGTEAGIGIGLFNRFMFGVSWGGNGLIGFGTPRGNKLPGVLVKYRLFEESMSFPAVTFGYDMQGHGPWYDGNNRYLYKASGAFVALSRNWISDYGRFGVHLGSNYNNFETDDQRGFDGFVGLDFSINEQIAFLVEYDLALDDNSKDDHFGVGPAGYLNAGFRLTFAQALVLQFQFMDLLGSSAETTGIGRELKIVYVETFSF